MIFKNEQFGKDLSKMKRHLDICHPHMNNAEFDDEISVKITEIVKQYDLPDTQQIHDLLLAVVKF